MRRAEDGIIIIIIGVQGMEWSADHFGGAAAVNRETNNRLLLVKNGTTQSMFRFCFVFFWFWGHTTYNIQHLHSIMTLSIISGRHGCVLFFSLTVSCILLPAMVYGKARWCLLGWYQFVSPLPLLPDTFSHLPTYFYFYCPLYVLGKLP